MQVCGNQTLLVAAQNFVKIGNNLSGVKGRDFEILKALSSKLKFKYSLVTPDDGQFGNCDDKGHCKGMIGMVVRHEADMAISHIAYTPSRAKYIDFSYPYFQEDITFATKNIDAYQEVNSKVFVTEPMDRQVWIFMASLLLIYISIIKVMEYFKLLKTKIMSVQTMLQILLRQSVNLDRNEANLAVAMALLVFVVTAGCTCKLYECMLASATSLAPVTPPIDTISDMVDAIRNRNYAISTLIGTSNYRRIMTSQLDYLQVFAASILKNNFVAPKTDKEYMRLLLKGKFALVASRTTLQSALDEMNLPSDTVHLAKEGLFVTYITVALRKNSPYKDDLNKWLNIFVDSGLIDKWQREYSTLFNQSTSSTNNVNQNYIGLSDLKLIFAILICGCLTGFVTLLIERYALVTPVDGEWGNCDNGQCSGMIGKVARHEADMAISDISPTTSRLKYVDFTCPYFQEELTFVTKSIGAYQEVDSVFFAEPMDRQVWILLGSLLVIFVSVVKIMEYFELLKSKIMSAQTILEIILRQSINLDRKKDKLSVVMPLLVFLITAGCICKLYECMLTSAASLIPVTPPIDTISDMINAIKTRGYVTSTFQGTSHYQELMESNLEHMKIFANSTKGKKIVAPKTAGESMKMLLNENFAMITTRNLAIELLLLFNLPLETLHCGKENIFNDNIAISLRKQFPCRDDIDKWLNVLVGVGLIGKWQHKDLKLFNQPRTTNKSDNVNFIGLSDLKHVFAILLCGCLLSFVSLLIERLTINNQSGRKNRSNKPNCAFNKY